ncbi:hypothetical protein AB0I35_12870 [Nocardia sp. NPDC050378]|uniref:hypothetical protein n=1 Tax=Nocardia sp. NPDC050378 TaxID=3155400 RepID=UPI0034103E50
MDKIAEAATQVSLTAQQLEHIRSPESWEHAVELWGDAKTLHDMLAYGYQHIHGRTPEQGWRQEYRQQVPGHTARQHDAAQIVKQAGREIVTRTSEYKAGGVAVGKGLEQLAKERQLLKSGTTRDVSEYIVRAARPPAPEVMREARKLEQEFPGKFKVIELSEKDFRRYIDAGRPIAHAKAVERLGHLIEKVRQAPELTTAPRALEGFVKEIEKAKEKGRPIDLEVLAGAQIELAQMIEVDKQITRERDKIAREAAQLRLKEAQIVERVQAQQREAREQKLLKILETVDREVVIAAVGEARALAPPAKGMELAIEPGMDPELVAMMQEMHHVIAGQEPVARQIDMLEYLPMPTPKHRELAGLALAQHAQQPGRPIAEAIAAAEEKIREREAKELEKAKAIEAQRVRELENRDLMARMVEAHNRQLERAALEQGQRDTGDRISDAQRNERTLKAAQSLRLDPQQLLKTGVDPRVVEALASKEVQVDKQAHALIVEVDGEQRWVDQHSKEAGIAKQIRGVFSGVDLAQLEVTQITHQSHHGLSAQKSKEALQIEREKQQKEHELALEAELRTKSRSREGPSKGIELGIERDR